MTTFDIYKEWLSYTGLTVTKKISTKIVSKFDGFRLSKQRATVIIFLLVINHSLVYHKYYINWRFCFAPSHRSIIMRVENCMVGLLLQALLAAVIVTVKVEPLICRVWLTGVHTGCFQHQYTDFGHTNLSVPKFNLKKNWNYH